MKKNTQPKSNGLYVSKGRKVFMAVNLLILTLLALSCTLPFVNLLAISFSNKNAVAANQVKLWPIGFNTAAYEFILNSSQFVRALGVSIRRTVLGVSLNMILIVLTAFPLSKSNREFRLRPLFSWIFVITMLFDGGLIPTYMIVRYTGLMDTIWALVLPGSLAVFNMLVVMNYMRSLPKELTEAAAIDGAGHFRTLWQIVLPVCKPTLATVTLFSFVTHWNSWFDGMIYMNRVENYPLQSYLQTIVINPDAFFRNATNVSESLSRFLNLTNARTTNAAQLFLATIPIMLVYPFLQRYFTSGLIMGSVKG
ncbi:MAG: carbohydrate ABC transporter permease [Clostridia bacterium]|nr:carbohydrate ABC transporter permease [Clostridia bacterium]